MADRTYRRTVTGREAHGAGRTSLYRIWGLIKQRCTNPNHPDFPRYGGRGIAMCARWAGSFSAFAEDMGPRPSDGHSVDRIDNNGGYEPSNCRWATRSQQARNRRNTHLFEHDGRSATLAEWSAVTGIGRSTLSMRLYKYGWSVDAALTTPVGGGRNR